MPTLYVDGTSRDDESMCGFISPEQLKVILCSQYGHASLVRAGKLVELNLERTIMPTCEDLYIDCAKSGWYRFGADHYKLARSETIEFFNVPDTHRAICIEFGLSVGLHPLFYTSPRI